MSGLGSFRENCRNFVARRTGWLARHFYFILRLFSYCRFSLLVVLGGGAVLLFSDQGQEMFLGLHGHPVQQVLLVLAVVFWAWQSWFWARLIIDARDAKGAITTSDKFSNFVKAHLPRFLGTLAFLCAVKSLYANDLPLLALVVFGLAVVFYLYWMKLLQLPKLLGPATRAPLVHLVSVLLVLILTIWALGDPVSMGFNLGSATVAFMALASIALFGNFLVYISNDNGAPVVLLLFLWAGFLAYFDANDNHAIRELNTAKTERKDLLTAFEDWKKFHGDYRSLV